MGEPAVQGEAPYPTVPDVIKNFVYEFFRVRVHSVFGRGESNLEERLESDHGLCAIWFDGAGR